MLQEIRIKNYKSFRDEAELSFEAQGDDAANHVVVMPDGTRLLRFLVILGANASGKSNLLDAIEFLRCFWNNLPHKNDEGTEVQPFLMQPDALSFDTEFEVKFYINGVRYRYKLTINPEKVCNEELLVYLTNRPTRVFIREDVGRISRVTFNPTVVKISQAESDVFSISCLRNMSVLAVLKKVNIMVPYLDEMRQWIDRSMMPLLKGGGSDLSIDTKNRLVDDEDFKQYLMQFTREADFNISDIKVKKMAALFGHRVETSRGEEEYILPESCQSAGTTRVVELESTIYNLLRCEGVLCIDELEASLHPNLMEFMLMKFLTRRDNQSQLIVTTHYDPILRGIDDLFGRDSVWFTEKGKDGSSSLFSLVDFKGLNKLSSIHRAYMNGQFGAIPNVLM